MVDFRRHWQHSKAVTIRGVCVECVHTYKYPGGKLGVKLNWTTNTELFGGQDRTDSTASEGCHHSMSAKSCCEAQISADVQQL